MTTPYRPEADQAIRQAVTITATAELVYAGDTIPLALDRLDLTFDEGWAPYAQATLVAGVDDDVLDDDALDPRLGPRLVLTAGYTYPDGTTDTHPLADLLLDELAVERDDTGSRLIIDASSDETLLLGWVPSRGSSRVYAAGAPIRDVIVDLIEWAIPDATIVATLDTTYVLDELLTVDYTSRPWDIITDLADFAYGWVYHDAAGAWRVVDRPRTASRTAHVLKTGPNGTIGASRAVRSRRPTTDVEVGYANAVLLHYANDVDGYAELASGPLAPVNGAPYVLVEMDRTRIRATQESADSAARHVLLRASSRGRRIEADAVAALWLRPGDTVTTQLPTGGPERALLARVAFTFPDGRMAASTRQPFTADITNGA